MKHKIIRIFSCLRGNTVRHQQPESALTEREEAIGTLEVVVITGILLTIALLFNTQIRDFAGNLFSRVFNDSRVISNILK